MSRKRVYHCNKHQNVLWLRAAIGRDINKLIIVKLLIDTERAIAFCQFLFCKALLAI